jgi:hypothetical protein
MSQTADPNTGLVFHATRVYTRTSAPTSTNDASDNGISIGDMWINTVAGTVYICTDPTPGAAVWFNTTPAVAPTLTLTDGTNTVTGVTTLTVAGTLTVSGATPNGTVTGT